MKNCKRCSKSIPINNYCGKCYTLNFRERNPGRMEELCADYYKDNKERYIIRATKRNKENPIAHSMAKKKYDKNSNYQMNRYYSDIQYRLIKTQRARIRAALKGFNKSQTTKELLGCSIEEFKQYLESKFLVGMTWDNYGKFGWHIDHIVPISHFDLTDDVQLKQACNHANLQPLWWQDNIAKRDKI